jgi:hypothetical protein
MRIGTKSVLFGYHALWLHGWFVMAAWWQIYSFPWDLRLWAAFFLHDIGYFGKPNMDGVEGKQHPFAGALLMHYLFDDLAAGSTKWMDFCLCHSRSLARTYFKPLSRLCSADKLAFCLYPDWLLKLLYRLSGEGKEYMSNNYPGSVQDETGLVTDDIDEWIHQGKVLNYQYLTKECPGWNK